MILKKNQLKDIFFAKTKKYYSIEKEVKKIKNCVVYIFDNLEQSLDEQFLLQSYYLLTNTFFADFVTNKIIDLYYKNIDVAPHALVALLHLYIINNVDKHNIEFAFLISNYIMLKKDRWFLIPCQSF